jgi:NAD+ kinase
MSAIRHLALVVNESKSGASDLAEMVSKTCARKSVTVKNATSFPIEEGFFDGLDACCVIGGDGTLLHAAKEATRAQVPIIGVNRGSLGFLTTFAPEDVESGFDAVLDGGFRIDYRNILECRTDQGIGYALNEVLIRSEVPSRITHIRVFADDELVTRYSCDGLIFSTPTGSTAYNISAGGPLIHPRVAAVALTPICPHTLSNRTVIFPDDVRLRVENCSPEDSLLVAVDGDRGKIPFEGGQIHIRLAGERLPLAVPLDYEHFRVVRTKLKWSGGVSDSGEGE